MKTKFIMLVTLLLLAVLAIGAVSAEDNNVTSDDLQVADEGDDVMELSGYDSDEHYINVYDDIDLDNEYETVADICLPANTQKGSFRVYNGNDEVARLDINRTDTDHWEIDDNDDEILDGYMYVSDFNVSKVKDGDVISFMFFEFKSGGYVAHDGFTVNCKVTFEDSVMKLTEMDDDDADIQISSIDLNKPDENFTYLNVTQREGFFIISTDNDDTLFKENLKTTQRHYVESVDGDGIHHYTFGFSLADLDSYISKNIGGADSLSDLISKNVISSGDDWYFEIYEDDNDEDSDIFSEDRTILIKDNKIFFIDDDEDVDVDYDELDIIMGEGWNETIVLVYEVKKGINGKIVIYLNDNQAPAFEKSISQMTANEDSDEDFSYYDITVSDLNITGPGKYVLRYFFDDQNGVHICEYDAEDPEILTVYAPQTAEGGSGSIDVNPRPISVDSDEVVITLNVTDEGDDNVTVYVDGNETPLTIKLSDCAADDDGNYVITSADLNLEVGVHTLNVTCKDVNLVASVNITTDLDISLPDDDEIIYTNFNDIFVLITLLDEKDITAASDITGMVNVTIIDGDGNVAASLQKDLDEISAEFDLEAYVIRVDDMGANLNGTYTVFAKYFGGNRGIVEAKANVTFKEFDADDYGTSISDTIDDDDVITFTNVPLDTPIIVEIDGNRTVEINGSDLSQGFDDDGNVVYSIKQDQLGLTDGTHSLNVYVETSAGRKALANVNVMVDLEKNVDSELTIAVADIEEGSAANVAITTNSTFTGNVTVQVADKNYTVKVENGKGSISIADLKAGTYTATAFFKQTGLFNASTKTATFKVTAKQTASANKKEVVKVTLKKVKVKKSAKKLVLKATVKVNGKAKKGLKVTFKIKGKKVGTKKTNKKGVAKLTLKKKALKKTLKKAKVGKKIKIQATCKGTTKTIKVKVKK